MKKTRGGIIDVGDLPDGVKKKQQGGEKFFDIFTE